MIILPGTPTATESFGISFSMTEFAPILELSPIVMLPRTFAPAPIITLFPIVGCLFPLSSETPPRITP